MTRLKTRWLLVLLLTACTPVAPPINLSALSGANWPEATHDTKASVRRDQGGYWLSVGSDRVWVATTPRPPKPTKQMILSARRAKSPLRGTDYHVAVWCTVGDKVCQNWQEAWPPEIADSVLWVWVEPAGQCVKKALCQKRQRALHLGVRMFPAIMASDGDIINGWPNEAWLQSWASRHKAPSESALLTGHLIAKTSPKPVDK